MEIIKETLNSGLKLLIVPRKNTSTVSVNITYRVGSKDEVRGKTGLAHLFEHLMFEGTPNVPKGKFDIFCSTAGGTNNAYTTYDWTTYYMTVPSNQLELALWLESDRLYNFQLDQEVLDVQKKVVTEEIYQTVIDQPYGQWRDYLAENAFSEDSSYSWEVQGFIEDVQSVTLQDAEKFRNSFYKPSNAVLTIVGDVSKDDIELVKKYFSQKFEDAEKIPRNKFSKELLRYGNAVSFKDKVPHTAVFLSFHLDGFIQSEEQYIAKLYTDIMARGKSSKLYNSLVYDKEIASHAGVFLDSRENTSLLTFFTLAKSADIDHNSLYDSLVNEIKKYNESSFTENDLLKAKNYIKKVVADGLINNEGIADNISKKEMFYNDPDLTFRLLEKYDKVELNDIEEFMTKKINIEDSIRVNVLPKK